MDGNDVLAVYEAAKSAVEHCRAGDGPVLIEVKTHRMRGHAQHDPAEYVPKPMREYWEARDPIDALRKISDRKQNLGRRGKEKKLTRESSAKF